MKIDTGLPTEVQAAKERVYGIIFAAVFSIIPAAAVCAILTFGLQNGLPVTERCHCSMEKVIAFSIAAFFVGFLQSIGYYVYDLKYLNMKMSRDSYSENEWYSGKNTRLFVGWTAACSLIPAAIAFFILPLFFDQNANMLWFFQSAMGILCVVITILASVGIGVLQKIRYTQHIM